MAGHSVLADFWVEPEVISNLAARTTLLQDLLPVFEPCSGSLKKVFSEKIPDGHHVSLFASGTMTLFVKMYKQGLVSAALEYFVTEESVLKKEISIDDGIDIEKELVSRFRAKKVKVLPTLKRGPPLNLYFNTCDERLLEYDVDQLVFEQTTAFQKVQIFHTKSYGNCLVLDNLHNIAESDLIYTQYLMNIEKENFKGKEVLILGGGDGALLWELLKEEPTFVTLIDIDEVVIKACREHMRSICGDCLDNYEGKNYKIIIGDAIVYMREKVKEERKFDYVFGDLTEHPFTKSLQEPFWDLMNNIMNLGTQLLKPSGKYMTHAMGIQCESLLKTFEEQITNLKFPVRFTKTNCYVPSFMENWSFYQISPNA